jgi:hypothetical protein
MNELFRKGLRVHGTVYKGPSGALAKAASDYLEECIKNDTLIPFRKDKNFKIRVTDTITYPVKHGHSTVTYVEMCGVLV